MSGHDLGGDVAAADLGAEIAAVLSGEVSGLSCGALARRLHRRDSEVRDVLRSDPRFVRVGHTRGTRWRFATVEAVSSDPTAQREPQGATRAGMGRDPGGDPGSGAALPVGGAEIAAQHVGPVRQPWPGEWPPEADRWQARDGRWRSTSTEPPHWPGEVVALSDEAGDLRVPEQRGGLRPDEARVVAWAERAGQPLDPCSADDAAVILRAGALVGAGVEVGQALVTAHCEVALARDGVAAA